ncbi:MAG: AAA family ATPase [bacterium]
MSIDSDYLYKDIGRAEETEANEEEDRLQKYPSVNDMTGLEQEKVKTGLDLDLNKILEIDHPDYQIAFETTGEINHIINFVCENIVDREEIVRQSFYAILTGEHQLILGRTGMAKSLLARQIFSSFEDIKLFQKQLTKDTMPDNMFGAYNMDDLKRGKLIHNIKGSIVASDFAFLDEIFDANDMLLRSLLTLLNEKRLVNGEQIVDSPLNTVIAASNYIRATEMLEAVLDRFLYKCYIMENKNLYYKLSIDQVYRKNVGKIRQSDVTLDLERLNHIKLLIKTQSIKIPEYILFLKNYIIRKYTEESKRIEGGYNFMISDRTAAKTQNLLRASAILDGRAVVEERDLNNLYYLICIVGKEEEKRRLKGIIDATKKYFFDDKQLLNRLFNIMSIFRTIKSAKDPGALVEHQNFGLIIDEIERSFVEASIKNRLMTFVNKIGFRPSKSRLIHLLEIFEESCSLLKEMAIKKETLELIEGFEHDVKRFNDVHFRQSK